ncbi:hypothetical protein JIN85_03185 [Luteolibacter pohnpeiensis]|uniref:Uncharacterized protein n=1 Tax=Luteolibacter pohnpeiensis TaxID=454153 RepID=A0A934S9R6_9BACT|nr:hypothetical protein [Luteolibacter pohnpeiensis]MBK1881403.1 hypothetical protein [Luteolibacter pohnpeiensis]
MCSFGSNFLPYAYGVVLLLGGWSTGWGNPESGGNQSGRSTRFAISDLNQDGWDDLWLHLFPKVDITRPGNDDDGDGKSNYEEMLDFTDPEHGDLPIQQVKAEVALEIRKEIAVQKRARDQEKLGRFRKLLTERGVMKSLDEIPHLGRKAKAAETSDESRETSSIHLVWPSTMLCSTGAPVVTKIIAMERLSNGQTLLAWQGEPGGLFRVEFSDDLVEWYPGADFMPVVGDTGTWGQWSQSSKRFYRVVETGYASEVVSDASGGDGTSTFGGTVAIDSLSNQAIVTTNLPSGMGPGLVELMIDGERVGYCNQTTSNTYTYSINRSLVRSGSHSVYARIDCSSYTTPEDGVDTSATVVLRTPEVAFINDDPGLTGIRASEDQINGGEPGDPTSTEISFEFSYISSGGQPMDIIPYHFTISDEYGNPVRQHSGEEPGPGPGKITFEWDGTMDDGSTAPDGPYNADFYLSIPGDIGNSEPLLIRNGPTQFKLLALGETLLGAERTIYRPEWWTQILTTGGSTYERSWGPWTPLGAGPQALIGGLQDGIGKAPRWKVNFWLPDNKYNAQPWGRYGSPAVDIKLGTAYNDYDMGFLIGHGVASSGGTYTDVPGQQHTLPPQHYLPFIADRGTSQTVWLQSGTNPKFGSGKLKWMYVISCNYLRVAAHNGSGLHDIYDAMKNAGTLQIGPGLHILGSFTTSVDIDGKFGEAFSTAALQQDKQDSEMTLVNALDYAWLHSDNSKTNKSNGTVSTIRNARSVYWPECEGDTLPGVKYESFTQPNGDGNQMRLDKHDSYYE